MKQIALNKDILSSEEHIELLIQSEKLEKKEGFMQRIEALELLKKQKKLMREAYHNQINQWRNWTNFWMRLMKKKTKWKIINCVLFIKINSDF